MSTDSEESTGSGDGSVKIDVRVPVQLVERIDEEYEQRGYASRSEAIRDALRAWVDPPVRLSDEILDELAESRSDAEHGDTRPLDDVMDAYGVSSDESS